MGTWYQTKYALTQGIKEITDGSYSESNQYISHNCCGYHGFDRVGVDIFATIEEARADQSGRARKSIAAAEKKITKLKDLL